MKKFSFLLMLLFVSVISIKAQQGGGMMRGNRGQGQAENGGQRTMPTAQEMADKETQRQTKMLELTPDQVAKVKVINLKFSQQRADLMKDMAQTQDRSAIQNKIQGIRLAQGNELKTVLTADQQAKLVKAHSDMDNGGKGNGQKHSGGGQRGNGAPQGINNN